MKNGRAVTSSARNLIKKSPARNGASRDSCRWLKPRTHTVRTVSLLHELPLVKQPLILSLGRSPVQLFITYAPLSESLPPPTLRITRADNEACHLKGHSILTVSCLITNRRKICLQHSSGLSRPSYQEMFLQSHGGLKEPSSKTFLH